MLDALFCDAHEYYILFPFIIILVFRPIPNAFASVYNQIYIR